MKRLLVLSGKGGTGKTTVSSAIIRLSGAKAVADCDVDAPNLHLVLQQSSKAETSDFMGGEKAVVDKDKCIGCGKCESLCRFNAVSLKDGKADVNEYACEGCGVCGYVCPASAVTLEKDVAGKKELYTDPSVFSTATLKMGRGNSGKLVTEVKLAMFTAAKDCDFAVIDGSPGIGCPVISSVSGADLILIVTEPTGSGVSDLKRLCRTVTTFRADVAVCVNKYDISPERTEEIQQFCNENNIHFAGKIPFDPQAVRAVNSGLSVADIDCPAAAAIKEIYSAVRSILGQQDIMKNQSVKQT